VCTHSCAYAHASVYVCVRVVASKCMGSGVSVSSSDKNKSTRMRVSRICVYLRVCVYMYMCLCVL